jgi:antirestriction protein
MAAAEKNEKLVPRIYVTSLVDCDVGRRRGCWIDASQSVDEIRHQIDLMLSASPQLVADEWAIHDCENFFGLKLSGARDLKFVSESARLIMAHGAVFAELLNHFDRDIEKAKCYMQDGYCGDHDDVGWYAASFASDLYHGQLMALPDFIRNRIDWDSAGEALRTEGAIFTIECGGVVYVFDSEL